MALIICGDCQKEYSDYALACPQCARPTISQEIIKDYLAKQELEAKKAAKAKKELEAKKAAEAKKEL